MKHRTLIDTGILLTVPFLLVATINFTSAQENADTDTLKQNKEALSSLRETQRAERDTLRLEQVRSENPALAAEMEALRAERETSRTERDAEFREKYPLLAEQRDEMDINRESGMRQGRKGKSEGYAGGDGDHRRDDSNGYSRGRR